MQIFEQYKEFQSIRHDNDGMVSNASWSSQPSSKCKKSVKLMICICSERENLTISLCKSTLRTYSRVEVESPGGMTEYVKQGFLVKGNWINVNELIHIWHECANQGFLSFCTYCINWYLFWFFSQKRWINSLHHWRVWVVQLWPLYQSPPYLFAL